jgi:hypothetical protein
LGFFLNGFEDFLIVKVCIWDFAIIIAFSLFPFDLELLEGMLQDIFASSQFDIAKLLPMQRLLFVFDDIDLREGIDCLLSL